MTDPLLTVSGVTKRFGGVLALDGAGFSVSSNEVVGLIGANGAGKTTLFDTISGFVRADAGSLLLRTGGGGTVELSRLRVHERAGLGVGRTFQNARLYGSLTVSETLLAVQHSTLRRGFWASVVGLGRSEDEAARTRAEEALALVGLDEHASKLVSELSYGMLRLCELACVVALRPRLLLLDEPSSGMAQKEVEALAPLLESVRAHLAASIILVEHDVPFVTTLAHRIVAMAGGRVIADGTADEVLADEAVVTTFLGGTVREASDVAG